MARELTKEQAMLLVENASRPERGKSTCGHTGCTDHLGQMQQTVTTNGGRKLSMEAAEEDIESAQWVILQSDLIRGPCVIVGGENPGSASWSVAVDMVKEVACEFCFRQVFVGECCSSHNKQLCHHCYRRTHFVQICIDGCKDCEAEGLDRVMKPGGQS